VLLAKRLTQQGVVFSGASVAAVLSAASASASAPPALVASTIKAASLFAASKAAAAGVISAKVAALAEGMVKTMFVNQLKSALTVVLLILGLGIATFGLGVLADGGPNRQPREANAIVNVHDGKAEKPKDAGQQPAQPILQPAKTDEERMVGWWTIVNDDGMRRKGEVWEIGKHQIVMNANLTGFRTTSHFHRLDGAKSPKQIDITVTVVSGVYGAEVPIDAHARIIGVIKGIYELDRGELRLCLGEIGKDRPAAFPEKPRPGEVLILHGGPEPKVDDGALKKAEKLRVLIDKVLAAHGGEDKLKKLQFTMTVKHSNLETQQYFVQPPKNFRWETTHRDRTSKRIVILFPEGRRWWTKEPNEDAKPFFPLGAEPTMEYWLDYVKFFGPRQVLRLKDADHRVALLDEEIKIDGRAAVGVEVTYTVPNKNFTPLLKMYFDKETHLLVKLGGNMFYYQPIYYSDYKKFDGIPIAQKEKDGYFNGVVTDFRAVDKLDAKLFEQP
jgi:uncharacterized protein (TIGR03067 family)